MALLVLIVGVLVGVAGGAAVALAAVRPALRERIEQRDELRRLERDLAAADARVDAQRETGDAVLGERLHEAVRDASTRAFTESSARFLDVAQARLATTVSPLSESLARVDAQVRQLEQARARSEGALTQQLSDLSQRTATLATALRTPHVRGRWGEIQLKRVVELAGMLPHCDFAEQVTATTQDGRLRPDLVVRLPGGRQVVVDAKVPLAAYLEALEAREEAVRSERLADHARQVRTHVQRLSEKRYWEQFTDSPDSVVMFLPDEGFFRAAWEQDPSLVELGVRSRVHIASPTTLIALLQAIAYGWQQEKVAEDARAIHQHGSELYKRLGVMGSHVAALGTSLDRAVDRYNKTVASLESRVLPEARKLEALVVVDEPVGDLPPVAATAVLPSAPELVQPALEVLPAGADAA